jgi:hypothetical protein
LSNTPDNVKKEIGKILNELKDYRKVN